METRTATRMFGALAHEHRLAVFRMLVQSGPEGRLAGEIASELGLLPSTLSFHLSALEGAGLVRSIRSGRYVHYGLRPEAIRSLLEFLTEDCCGGHPEHCGLTHDTSMKKTST